MKYNQTVLLAISVIIFSVFYNVGAGFLLLFDKSPAVINLLTKILGSLCCIIIFIKSFDYRTIGISKISIPLLLFLFVYSIRLIIDIFFLKLSSSYSNTLIVSYFFGGTILTSIVISIIKNNINLDFIIKNYLRVLFFSNLIVFALLLKNQNFNLLTIFSQRLSFGLSDSENNDIINSITISVNGALVLFYYIYKYVFNFKILSTNYLFDIFIIVVSFSNLILSGSRGPFLALFVVGFLILLQSGKINWNVLIGGPLIISVLLFSVIHYFDISISDIAYLKRIFDDGELTLFNDENRTDLFNSAVNQFVNNPVLGDKYFEGLTRTYPHNIFLEVLMSTGFLGGVLFLLNFLIFLYSYFLSLRSVNLNTFLFYLTAFYFLCSLFSSSIWGNLEFFIFSILYYKTYNSFAHKNV